MKIQGLVKTTLVDFPGHLACSIFLGGCNFLCPFCHNKSLVLSDCMTENLDENYIFDFLEKRMGILEGVCITGGEPTVHKDLYNFINKIKQLGYQVKLDTNGTHPNLMTSLISDNLIDYVAMDIKNSPQKYVQTVGLNQYDLENIYQSVNVLLKNNVPYEFRTTIVKEFHTKDDIVSIGEWVQGCNDYYLQSFHPSENQIVDGFSSYSKETLESYKDILKKYVYNVHLRGI
ncbi:pyruvate formate lyase activating enzyme [Natranaerovirga hydrolytica]|uniref:Pyruvate formate lyase activating enzyme n=1 Tax=Natranaerovirga hydrolytica TaxID=680378 RepID=A0A4R1N246_9FIRM|nr:anaerobic ribonucleoside-triphosphate reductase activating protein [Natranaerovirga hydrolytica]TCL00057.1 pyruvate formate lyase activating enzyme [Natranaerovirga hydrolytica]